MNANTTGIIIGRFYKVPHGQELPFAGRWLKATGSQFPGSVDFMAASGKRVPLCNSMACRLADTAEDVRVTTPKGFL